MKFYNIPVREVRVYEIIEHSLDDFINIYTRMGQHVTWCNGIVFVMSALPHTNDRIIEDTMIGIQHLKIVEFAKMPEYKEVIKKDFSVAVVKVQNSTLFNELTEWLKNVE